jgi:hypothetical protein
MTLSPVRWGFSFLAKPVAGACTHKSTTLIDVRLAPIERTRSRGSALRAKAGASSAACSDRVNRVR